MNSTELTVGDRVIVSDEESVYNGTAGSAVEIYEDHLLVELDSGVKRDEWSLVHTFGIGQLEHE